MSHSPFAPSEEDLEERSRLQTLSELDSPLKKTKSSSIRRFLALMVGYALPVVGGILAFFVLVKTLSKTVWIV